MSQMTSRERLLTALKGGMPDHVPVAPNITRWVRGNRGCCCLRHMLAAAEEFEFDPLLQLFVYTYNNISNNYIYSPGGGQNFSVDGMYGDLKVVDVEVRVENRTDYVWYHRTFKTPAGILTDIIQWARPDMGYGDGPNPHRVEPLVKSEEDLKAFSFLFPDPRRDLVADIPLIKKECGDRALLAACDCLHFGAWGTEALGPENMLIASVAEPELLKSVCRIVNDAHLKNLKAYLENGIEFVCDSWFQCSPSTGWSPTTYKNIFLPLVKEAVALTHHYNAIYAYQDDGKMKDIIPLVVEAGADVLSGLQPPDVGDVNLADVKKQYGSKVALIGGLDPCYTFDRGNVKTVRDCVKQAIKDAGGDGGFVIGTAEAIAPSVSSELLRELSNSVRKYGKYTANT